MISYRGILALAIGAVFLWFAFQPAAFGEDTPPLFVSAILVFAGAGLAAMGAVSMRFVYRRSRLIREAIPESAQVVITVDDSSDSTTYNLEVRLPGGVWNIGAVGNKTMDLQEKDIPLQAQVWRDPKTGAPSAIAINGRQINTMPIARPVSTSAN